MIIVSDTSPVTALLHVDRADLLRLLFGRVIIPPAVETELLRDHPILPEWVEVVRPIRIPDDVSAASLDAGETEAIALALELKADVILLDERRGRRLAASLGLVPTGVLGCLVLAKREGHLDAIAPVIEELQRESGCWFDGDLIEAVLRAAGE